MDSGWVPADTNIDDFEMAIRTVCEPIFQKPLADISFGNVLLQLFNTARRFNMQVQPQLVLLQKTLLYVEGLGRTLYPQLDLWKTAKPFLENWMKEQIGPKALFDRVKESLPFWSEKLPEMPDLLYDAMRQMRQLPQQLEKQHQTQIVLQTNIQKARMLGKLAMTLTVTTAILHVFEQHWGFTLAAACGAGMAWIFTFLRLDS